jgi:hypothetical protein
MTDVMPEPLVDLGDAVGVEPRRRRPRLRMLTMRCTRADRSPGWLGPGRRQPNASGRRSKPRSAEQVTW